MGKFYNVHLFFQLCFELVVWSGSDCRRCNLPAIDIPSATLIYCINDSSLVGLWPDSASRVRAVGSASSIYCNGSCVCSNGLVSLLLIAKSSDRGGS